MLLCRPCNQHLRSGAGKAFSFLYPALAFTPRPYAGHALLLLVALGHEFATTGHHLLEDFAHALHAWSGMVPMSLAHAQCQGSRRNLNSH